MVAPFSFNCYLCYSLQMGRRPKQLHRRRAPPQPRLRRSVQAVVPVSRSCHHAVLRPSSSSAALSAPPPELRRVADLPRAARADKLQSRSPLTVDVPESYRRHAILCSGASLVCFLTANCVKAKEKSLTETEDEGGNGVLESIKSLFDPNEKTNSGKILPKAYLQAAREVVKTLRDSLGEDADDIAKFRRTADAAKESIRNYLNGWRGQKAVVAEESYAALERAIRSLAGFYSKAGPFAKLPEDVKRSILDDLSTAEAYL